MSSCSVSSTVGALRTYRIPQYFFFFGNRPPRRARETYDEQRWLSYVNLDAPMHPAPSVSGVFGQHPDDDLPIIMVINATSLAKPNAMQLLEADMKASCVDVVVITESWFKTAHDDQYSKIDGYTCLRQDRSRQRRGGMCIYIKPELNTVRIKSTSTNVNLEVL